MKLDRQKKGTIYALLFYWKFFIVKVQTRASCEKKNQKKSSNFSQEQCWKDD